MRLGRTRLRALLVLGYRSLARLAVTYLTRDQAGAAAYLRGGLATEEFQPGLSDIDLVLVLAHPDREPCDDAGVVRARWRRLTAVAPAIELVIDEPRIHSETELAELNGASAFTLGLDESTGPGRSSGYYDAGDVSDGVRMLERPGLGSEIAGWQRLSGRERRPAAPRVAPAPPCLPAWLELLYVWRIMFRFCVEPTLPRATSVCVKMIAEPARIWLWLTDRELPPTRELALRRAAAELPEEADAFERALDLQRALPSAPRAPLAELLPAFVRLSGRVASLVGRQAGVGNGEPVRLAGSPRELLSPRPTEATATGSCDPLPLGDWRSLACPASAPDESFRLLPGDPANQADLAAATKAAGGPYPALRAPELLVLPTRSLLRSRLRAVKCPASDPVPFALAAGADEVRFPTVRGWSAADTAARAVAEQRAWLSGRRRAGSGIGSAGDDDPTELGRLLSAARGALFLESVEDGDPELCLTAVETARRLARRSPAWRSVAEEAIDGYSGFVQDGRRPPPGAAAALRDLVGDLPAFR